MDKPVFLFPTEAEAAVFRQLMPEAEVVIIGVGIYALNLVDAFVFGHLYDFQIDDNISLALSPGFQPTISGWQPTVGFTLSF